MNKTYSRSDQKIGSQRHRNKDSIASVTIITLRWIAVLGQTIILAGTWIIFKNQIPIIWCVVALLALILSNLLISPSWSRGLLAPIWIQGILIFDLAQISLLLWLTGGLFNPFISFLLVPTIISTILICKKFSIAMILLSLVSLTFLWWSHLPVPYLTPPSVADILPFYYQLGIFLSPAVLLVFLTIYIYKLSHENRYYSTALAQTERALGQEQHLSQIGIIATSVAHELGTPLATMTLITADINAALAEKKSIQAEDIRDDIEQLEQQLAKCRESLKNLAQSPHEFKDVNNQGIALLTLCEEILKSHSKANIKLSLEQAIDIEHPEPNIHRTIEIRQALNNIISNALDFAQARVILTVHWTDQLISFQVRDDGQGFSKSLLENAEKPYVSTRNSYNESRNSHWGLGLYIARASIERVGGQLMFGNISKREQLGAEVIITIPVGI